MILAAQNAIIAEIEPPILSAVGSRLELIELEKGEILHQPGEEVRYVYFPQTAVLTVGVESIAGETSNISLLGREGVTGAFEACGSRQSFTRVMVQIAGAGWRVPAPVYREMFDKSAALRIAMHKHMEMLLVEARQFVACNALHPVEGRLSRALLDALDRTRGDRVLTLTQEVLAQFLGVQRSTVAASMSDLQRAGLLKTGRGVVRILDIAGLQAAACPCHATITYAKAEIQSSPGVSCEA
jgi:CRP-like cAMP-binding protein